MNTILEALFGWLFGFAGKWLANRKLEKDNAAVTANRDAAATDSQQIRDTTAEQVDESHGQTDAALAGVSAADSLRKQSADVQRAIDSANDSVRGA